MIVHTSANVSSGAGGFLRVCLQLYSLVNPRCEISLSPE